MLRVMGHARMVKRAALRVAGQATSGMSYGPLFLPRAKLALEKGDHNIWDYGHSGAGCSTGAPPASKN